MVIDTSFTTSGNLAWSQLTTLEQVEYNLVFYWSTRESTWYLSILDQNDNHLADWIRIVINSSLLRRFQASGQTPPGLLIAMDMSGTDAEIAQPSDLGSRAILSYTPSTDPGLVGFNLYTAA